jgi:RNA polymerase sigma-70 factor (ECF subfamily)
MDTYLSDAEIIKRCQQGDEQAFQELVNRYQQKVLWIAYRMVGNKEDCKDISQEAFIRIYRSIKTFNLTSNFYTWLYRIVCNLSIDFLRKKKSTRSISFEEIGEVAISNTSLPGEEIKKSEQSQEMQTILQKIHPDYRVILILREIEDYSCKEIASIISCNANTVRWRLFRARQIFQKLWKKHLEEQEERLKKN